MSINQENSNNIESSIFKKQGKAPSTVGQELNSNHRKFNSVYDLKALAHNGAETPRVDQETIDGKKVATVKDRARLRNLIKNIQTSQNKVEANLNDALGKSKYQ